MASSLEGLSPSVPLYKVTEGNEPCFFTAFFSWDPAKAITHGNSFQKKVMLLLGSGHAAGEKSEHDGPTQRASALAALNSAFSSSSSSPSKPSSPRPVGVTQGSQRAAAIAALSTVLTAENKQISIKSPSAESSPTAGTENENISADIEDSEVKESDADESTVETNEEDEEQEDGNDSESNLPIFSYEQLKAKSENPIMEIDFKRREGYLSDEEFEAILGMPKEAFYKLPKWKQDQLKKKVDLF
ncbi:unnamed protein product [Cuscuta campestris]|uniref:HP domain-containing protein n=1 Tax=Cuscuta campestris TaxID=132261 RepID=A0A484MQJ6_9ASTE|nr:unnamed protein product [Cuscuta campestris]